MVAGVMAGMNSETRVNFQGDPGVQVDAMKRVNSGPLRINGSGIGGCQGGMNRGAASG